MATAREDAMPARHEGFRMPASNADSFTVPAAEGVLAPSAGSPVGNGVRPRVLVRRAQQEPEPQGSQGCGSRSSGFRVTSASRSAATQRARSAYTNESGATAAARRWWFSTSAVARCTAS